MIDCTANLNLDRRAYGLRFVAAETEDAYRSWRNTQNLPVVRLAGAVSVPPWLAAPLLGNLWRPDIDWMSLWWLGYALAVPTLVVAVLASYTRWHRHATRLSALSLCVAGCTMLWIVAVNMHGLEDIDASGPATATMLVMASFALFMRHPPLLAVLSIMPFMLALLAFIHQRFVLGELNALYTYAYLMIPCVMYFFVGVMAVVQERFMRRAYVDATTVVQQQSALQRSSDLIRRYVPPAVAEQIAHGNEAAVTTPQRRRITVLFSDVVGFTHMADRLDAESMTQILNEYMAAMADLVQQHGGTLNEFSGDGLMALFGAPNEMSPEDQIIHAVQAAQAMHARLPALNEGWLKLGIGEPLKIRIGINTGVLSVGSFGSQGRMTYTAIGLQTNIAARIQAHCEPGGVLLSDASWHLVKDKIACEPKGEVECKGVHFPVKVYAPSR